MGLPGLEFSQTTGFEPVPQGSDAACAGRACGSTAHINAATTARRPPRIRLLHLFMCTSQRCCAGPDPECRGWSVNRECGGRSAVERPGERLHDALLLIGAYLGEERQGQDPVRGLLGVGEVAGGVAE